MGRTFADLINGAAQGVMVLIVAAIILFAPTACSMIQWLSH